MAVRREVLGDAHVDRATANATDFTREFQEFITEYAWGGIWTRPGLDRRSRSLITLTALIARGHHEELAMHVRAARTNGLTNDEIKELILQSAIYCGVPDANTAFRIAQGVLDELDRRRRRHDDAFVYDAVRTPFGKFNGGLAGVRPDDLAAVVLGAVRDRNPELDPERRRRGDPRQRQRRRRGEPQRRPDGRPARRASRCPCPARRSTGSAGRRSTRPWPARG